MRYMRRLFKPHRLIIAPPMPPLIERRTWNEYTQKMRQVLEFDILYDLGELTEEDRKAHLTRQLATPSVPTLHDVNRTGKWHIYSAQTDRVDAPINQGWD